MTIIWQWCRESLTIVWARVQALAGILIAVSGYVLDLLHMPGVTEAIQGVINPKFLPFFGLGLSLLGGITELCRRRTLEVAP